MKILKFLAAFLMIIPLSGCFGDEPNNMAYVVALGIDKSQSSENYEITVQFARPTQISGGASEEGGTGGAGIVENIVIEAPNIYAGMNIANHVVSKKFSLYHTKLIVFSQELAREGIGDFIETMSKSDEIRPDTYLAVALGSANEYLSEVKPVVELNPSQYYQLSYDKNNAPGFPRCTLQNFYLVENTDCGDVALPIAGVIKSSGSQNGKSQGSENQSGESQNSESQNSESQGGKSQNSSSQNGKSQDNGSQDSKSQSSKSQSSKSSQKDGSGEGNTKKDALENTGNTTTPLNESGFEYKIKNYIAGEVGVKEKNKSETMGMAVFSGKQMAGVMGGIDALIYNILKGEYRGSYVTFHAGNNSDVPVTVRMIQTQRPLIKINTDNKRIDIKLHLEADLYSLSTEYMLENNLDNFENTAKEEIDRACTDFIDYTRNVYKSDVLCLGMSAKKKFMTNKDFNDYNWREKFGEYDIYVDSDFKVRRTGFTMREK